MVQVIENPYAKKETTIPRNEEDHAKIIVINPVAHDEEAR